MYPDIQKRMAEIMEKGAERFDTIEQCLEERATVSQLSELTAELAALKKRVEEQEATIDKVAG
jgi:hypothetical protein